MTHVEKFLLRAVNPVTLEVIREKWVYDRHTAECFAADWHMHPKTRTANIYVGKTLIYGYDRYNTAANFVTDDDHSGPSEPPAHVTSANARELFGWKPGETVGEAALRCASQDKQG